MDSIGRPYDDSQFTLATGESLYQNFENLSISPESISAVDGQYPPQSELLDECSFSNSIASPQNTLSEGCVYNSHFSSDQHLSQAEFPQPHNFSCTQYELTSDYPQLQGACDTQYALQSSSIYQPILENEQRPEELENPSFYPSSADSLMPMENDVRESSAQSSRDAKAARLRARGVTIQTPRGPILFIPSENDTENSYIPSGSDPTVLRLLEERDRLLQDKDFPKKLELFQRLLEQKMNPDHSKKKSFNSNS